MKRVMNDSGKTLVVKRNELTPLSTGVLARAMGGLVALGQPPQKEPPPPDVIALGQPPQKEPPPPDVIALGQPPEKEPPQPG